MIRQRLVKHTGNKPAAVCLFGLVALSWAGLSLLTLSDSELTVDPKITMQSL